MYSQGSIIYSQNNKHGVQICSIIIVRRRREGEIEKEREGVSQKAKDIHIYNQLCHKKSAI